MNVSLFSLDGKVAIVTGGKKGIGKVIALAFAEAGVIYYGLKILGKLNY